MEVITISIDSSQYPESLKKVSDAPKVLYYAGQLPRAGEACVAVVGTRLPSPYGQQAALQIAGQLAESGVTVVSGLAPGIDTLAHAACVEKSRPTIAVLGTGLDEQSMYPRENRNLAKKIIETGGCLISEFPAGTRGSKFSFPRRNRIIAALSAGTVVVEAKEKSGSLITAGYAKKYQKKLFAVPGQIFTTNAKGPNMLIKNGATLIEHAGEVLDALQFAPPHLIVPQTVGQTPHELAIFTVLKETPLHVDDIIKQTTLAASLVAQQLALMEISGKIRNLGGNIYAIS